MIESKKITNPFPGLRPFETDEYRLFFGREGQSDALIARLQHTHFLAIVGTSGSGKSSLVRAGLLPALRGGMMAGAGSGWRIAIMRPGSDPIGNLALALANEEVLLEAGGGLPPAEAEAVIEATLRRGSLGLVEAVRQTRLAEHEKLLVVVDQFEELFRFRAARAPSSTGDDASAFVKLLLEASQQQELSIYVVPTMRSDFLGDCAQFQGLPEAINDGQYLIPRMTRDERRVAITGPVGVTRGKIAEPLVNRLMNDVGDNPDQLPILQHALMRTWYFWDVHRSNGEPIGLEHYEAIGTMSEALSKHADEAFEALPDELRSVAESLFKTLTERGADNREVRRPTRLKDICEIAEASAQEVVTVIDVFRDEGCSFLMPPAGVKLQPETVIDISHESLIRNWDRLQEWVNEEAQSARIYRRLAEDAILHREGREGLLQDPALQIALDWRNQSKPTAAWAQRYYLEFDESLVYLEKSLAAREAALAERERERRQESERERRELEMARDFAEKHARAARRMRWLTAGMAVMFVLAIVTAGYAVAAKRGVERERTRAVTALEETDRQRKQIASTLQKKEEADVARVQAEGAREEALVLQKKALEKALIEEAHAKKEAERANTQARIAAENFTKAEAARKEAVENQRQVVAAVERGKLLREGIEAYRREKFNEALGFFEELRGNLEALQPGAAGGVSSLKSEQARQYEADLGWTLSNLGATYQKKQAFKEAIGSYEKALAVFRQILPKDSDDPILFDTYDGLARSYHAIARSRRRTTGQALPDSSKSPEEFKPAEEFEQTEEFKHTEEYFKLALAFQEEHRPSEVAVGYLNLARLYVDAGRFAEAEEDFKRTVKLRQLGKENSALDNKERSALAAALRELAEFYQGQEGHYDDAIRVLNEMIVVQEAVPVNELIDHGQEIANSYSDLGQIHAARGDAAKREAALHDTGKPEDIEPKKKAENEATLQSRKADDALRAANLLQRTTLRMRQMRKSQTPLECATLVIQLTSDLDELGDAYAKLGKFDYAEGIYLEALGNRNRYRDASNEEWKSYDKLTRFYGENKKDPAKAEEYKNLLKVAIKDNADALMQLGAIHADDPYSDDAKKPFEAEKYYRDALAIYKRQSDWMKENIILFRLSRLYAKQKRPAERDQALRDRVDTMARYFKQLEMKADPPPKNHVMLVSEYLYAVNALATRVNAEAEAAYTRALEAYDYITNNIDDKKVLDFYAATLVDYQKLLDKLGKQAEAVKVAEKANVVREKLRQVDQTREQQNLQPTDQGRSQSTSPQ